MKYLALLTLLILQLLWLPTSFAQTNTVQETFEQCLNSQPQDPTAPIKNFTFTPSNPSFTTVLQNYVRNLRFFKPTTPKPVAIVTAAHVSHVQAVIACAKNLSLQMRIRSGGHDYEGLSYVSSKDFIILDMFNLRSIDIDPTAGTAWVDAGANLGELYYSIANKSDVLGFPAGVCPGLGTGGHFSGGGYGNMMRKYGLSVDNIIDAKIVDVNGKILDRKSMGEDLFWALRGGGAASFCVVLAWKIKLVPLPAKVTVFNVERTVEDGATDLVLKWQQIADKIDNNLFIRLTLSTVNGSKQGEKTVKAAFMGMFIGYSEKLLEVTKASFPELGLQGKDCHEMKWIESILFWFNLPSGTPTSVLLNRKPKPQIYLKRKSDYVQQPIGKAGLDSVFKTMIKNEKISMAWNPYGGKMSEISETETPFPHRAGNIFKIQYQANWFEKGDEIADRYLNQSKNVYDAMTPYVSKNPREAFLNYRDIDIGKSNNSTYKEGKVYGAKYFKNNFERLVKVKTRVDPDNFFQYEQSIPTLPKMGTAWLS